jgi:hypothetical protein
LKVATKGLITASWYTDSLMAQIIETMRDYMTDYQAHSTRAEVHLFATSRYPSIASFRQPEMTSLYLALTSGSSHEAIDGYLDVAKRCTSALVEFVFNDLKVATKGLKSAGERFRIVGRFELIVRQSNDVLDQSSRELLGFLLHLKSTLIREDLEPCGSALRQT